ncbi:MAG: SDR family NAD(P)-dependent oxidoreductase [Microbispora sp.]|nr:SDR family NAD(P)-dependent oxidoreductase [Microbispora sp.]
MKAFLVTGASGFLGRRLILELRTTHPGTPLWALVRAPSQPAFRRWLAENRVPADGLVIVDADLTLENCGLDDHVLDRLRAHEVSVYHCAAHYDLANDDPGLNWKTNVEGTERVLRLAESVGAVSVNHASTVAVAGDYRGVWTEDHLPEATRWHNEYSRTKHQAERLVLESSVPATRVFRYGVLVGDAATGTYFKNDGVYSFFRAIKAISGLVPKGMPLPTFGWGRIPICPVDHAARATVALADAAGPGHSVFHIFEDEVPRADDLMRMVYRAAGHGRSLNAGWAGHLVQWFTERARHDSVLTNLKNDVRDILAEAGLPTFLLNELNQPTQFTNRATAARLRALGIRSTRFERYAPRLWHGWLAATAVESREKADGFFRGKHVLMTGATSGIGRSIFRKVLDRGAAVLVLGRNKEKLDEALSGVPAEAAGRVRFVECDLLDDESISRALREIGDSGVPVDVFIHSAGVSIDRSFLDMSVDLGEVSRMTQVNFLAPLRIMRAVLPGMLGRADARIASLSSISTQMNIPGFGPYAATKRALDQVFGALPTELLSKGVSFTTVRLPLVKSPMTRLNLRLRNAPMQSESAAAELVLSAVAEGRPVAGVPLGRALEVLGVLHPRLASLVSNLGWKVFLRLGYLSRVTGAALNGERG